MHMMLMFFLALRAMWVLFNGFHLRHLDGFKVSSNYGIRREALGDFAFWWGLESTPFYLNAR